MDEDLGRYSSAKGWQPKDPWKKQRDKEASEQAKELEGCDTMLELRSANAWMEPEAQAPAELFGPLWRTGELAVLLGEPQIGKSLLAVQIANDITKGNSLLRTPHSELRNQDVLYIDFQHTAAQWTERYSYRTPTLGRFVMPYEFPENFERAAVNWDDMDDEKFKRDPLGFAFHSIFTKIEQSNAKIVIIDDLTLGGVAALARNAPARIMHTLKVWTARKNLSILVVASVGPRVSSPHVSKGSSRRSRRSSLATLPSSLSAADSIFSLNPSTFGPQYRYIKPLRSPIHHSKFEIRHSQQVAADALSSSTPQLLHSSTPPLLQGSRPLKRRRPPPRLRRRSQTRRPRITPLPKIRQVRPGRRPNGRQLYEVSKRMNGRAKE